MTPSTPFRQRVAAALIGLIALVTAAPIAAQDFGFGDDDAAQLQAELIAEHQTLKPGEPTTVGVHFTLKKKWHLYWTNPEGDGKPPTVAWQLPEGYTVSEPRWPAPHIFPFLSGVQFGYEDSLTLLYEITPPADAPAGKVTLKADLTWLVCDDQFCVPNIGPQIRELTIPVSPSSQEASEQAGLIEAAEKTVPLTLADWSFKTEVTDGGYVLIIEAPSEDDAAALEGLYFYSAKKFVVDPQADQAAEVEGKTVRLSLKQRTKDLYGDPIEPVRVSSLNGVLTAKSGFGDKAIQAAVVGDVSGNASGAAKDDAKTGASDSGDEANTEQSAGQAPVGFALALGMAFLGGMILNLMPCVFPVLSIKILGFVNQAGENPAIVRRHGYAFGVGVMLSFWILIGIILALRSTLDLSWGFQLQNPIFVLSMILLCFLVGLNLLGTFEFGVALSAKAGQASEVAKKDGYTKSAFTGVLATLIATPCAAPFMAPAVGAAFLMPDLQAFFVFSMLGAGMATPYVVLSCFPKLLNYLPKPGPWMGAFKQAMAFPMFATAGWLSLTYIKLIDIEIADVLLMSLSAVALGTWVWGKWTTPLNTPSAKWIARGVGAFFIVFGLAYVHTSADKILAEEAERAAAREAGEYVYEWVDYSPEKIEAFVKQGRPVLVDFTASWCGICQDNKRRVLRTDDSAAFYEKHNVALVEADFTGYDREIFKALKKYQRQSVPLYLVYPADGGEPKILSNTLTQSAMENAVKQAAGKTTADPAASASR